MALSRHMMNQWRGWAISNLHRGVKPWTLAQQMVKENLSEIEIALALGDAYGAEPDIVDHEKIASCGITRRVGVTPGLKKIFTNKAQIFTWENFLPPEACEKTIALMEGHLRPSTVTHDNGDPKVRTSTTCDLGDIADPFVPELERFIANALGIHYSYSETTQCQKYEVGQEFKSHTDYFEPRTKEFLPNTETMGQRTWTFMVYLNSTPEGGGTRFVRLDKTFYPKQGMAVIWNNLLPDGRVNPMTLHHGMKPRRGEKYIITKWFREKGWGPMFTEGGA